MADFNIELTFSAGYSFDCTSCGICCQYVGGISLTSRERDTFGRSLDTDQFSTVNHAAFPYLLANDSECRYLKDGKCSIHGNHPLFCRLYPISFGYHSNKVFANLIHCEGVNTKNIGTKVDLTFVRQTIDGMVRLEGEGFPRAFLSEEGLLTQGRMPLFRDGTRVLHSDFFNRRRLLLSFSECLTSSSLDGFQNGSQRFQAVLSGPFSSLKDRILGGAKDDNDIDIGVALNEVSRGLSPHLSKGRAQLLDHEKRANGQIQAYDRRIGSTRFFEPEEEVELLDYYDVPINIAARLAFRSPVLDAGALKLELSYIQEILKRVGMGGLPYYLPLDTSLERLLIIVKELETYGNYLAQKDGIINTAMMTECIRNTDTRIMDLLV